MEIGEQGIALAYVLPGHDTDNSDATTPVPQLKHCEFLPLADGEDPQTLLHDRIVELDLKHTPCNVVLPAGSYSLLLVEAPKVEAEELRDALRWRVKDLVSFPIDDAAIDVFLLPDDASRGGNPMAYVVAVEKSRIEQIIALIKGAGLELAAIDIAELALRNLVVTCNSESRGIALVRLQQGRGNLHIMREGNLYLCRQFDLKYNGGLLDDLPEEALVLELQRSLDYYERQMRQAAPATLYFCGDNISDDKITPAIRDSLAGQVHLIDVAEHLACGEGIEPDLLPLCLTAIGGALRADEVAA